MAKISIIRTDKLPEVCVRCGQPRDVALRIRFARREKRNPSGLMTGLDILWLFIILVPTIGWSLPFCIDHSWSTQMKNRTQLLLLAATLLMIGFGGWWFATGHQGWPLVTAIIVTPFLLFAADHFELRPAYVSRDRLELDAAHEQFVEGFKALNQSLDEVTQDSNPSVNTSTG